MIWIAKLELNFGRVFIYLRMLIERHYVNAGIGLDSPQNFVNVAVAHPVVIIAESDILPA
jgi:hypothetical protein